MKTTFSGICFGLSACLLVFFSSCKSFDSTVNQEWDGENFFVAAQDASDNDNYDQALFYYQVFLTRYPENFRKVAAAQYEIGFIYYKKGQYKQARQVLEAVLELYATSPYIIYMEERYKTLSEIVIKNIDEKTRKKGKLKTS
jgi:outer membrane protein assembly factor BamD (BamD/ComL family)